MVSGQYVYACLLSLLIDDSHTFIVSCYAKGRKGTDQKPVKQATICRCTWVNAEGRACRAGGSKSRSLRSSGVTLP